MLFVMTIILYQRINLNSTVCALIFKIMLYAYGKGVFLYRTFSSVGVMAMPYSMPSSIYFVPVLTRCSNQSMLSRC